MHSCVYQMRARKQPIRKKNVISRVDRRDRVSGNGGRTATTGQVATHQFLNQSPQVQSILQLQQWVDQSPSAITQAKFANTLPAKFALFQQQDDINASLQLPGNRLEDIQIQKLQGSLKNISTGQHSSPLNTSQAIQRKLKYKDKIYGSMKDIGAEKGNNIWDVYRKSERENKKELLDAQNKVYDLENDFAEVNAENLSKDQIEKLEKDDKWSDKLAEKLNFIAQNKHGEKCHEVATEMQDAFNFFTGIKSEVLEIYSEDEKDNNHITIMGARVRNHYVNIYKGKAYDSRTGASGEEFSEYLKKIESENPDREIKHRKEE